MSSGEHRHAPGLHTTVAGTPDALALLCELAPVAVGIVAHDETIVDLQGALLEHLGYTSSEWVGRPFPELLEQPDAVAVIRRALTGESLTQHVVIYARRWLVTARPLPDPADGALVMMSYDDSVDVNRELSAQESLNRQLAAVIELSRDFVALVGLDRSVTYVNRAGRAMVGIPEDADLSQWTADDFLTSAGVRQTRRVEQEFLRTGQWQGESHVRHLTTGEAIPVWAHTYLVNSSEDDRPLAVASVRRDLREQRNTEIAMTERLLEQRVLAELGRSALTLPLNRLMSTAVHTVSARYPGLSVGVLRRDEDTDACHLVATTESTTPPLVVPIQPGSLSAHALEHDVLCASEDVLLDGRFPHSRANADYSLRAALACPIPGEVHPWGLLTLGRAEPCEWLEHDLGFVESVAATLAAAVRRHELETRLQHQALHDPLTGLGNRAMVLDRIENVLARQCLDGSLAVVMLLDLDDFKEVNDAFGHQAGDELLVELAGRLRAAVRRDDAVARLGGDEFVVVCEGLPDDAAVTVVADAVLAACTEVVPVAGRRLAMSASVGLTVSRTGGSTAQALLGEADIAMYRAKRDRPGTYQVFDEAMRGDVLGRIDMASELRSVVRSGGLRIEYQPIVDLASDRVVGMEALARWRRADGVDVPPAVFVPMAEENGLIEELGSAVLVAAVTEAAGWQHLSRVGVQVNVSANELAGRDYATRVLTAVRRAGLPTSLLGLEITESVLVEEDGATLANVTRLKKAGVTLLIDDFGTGYSSLSYLQRFPVVDVLKVDRSFLGAGPRGDAVVRAVVGLGHAFGLRVCAEGVETEEQHRRVRELGCDHAQGYLLGRPAGPEEARATVAATGRPRLVAQAARR